MCFIFLLSIYGISFIFSVRGNSMMLFFVTMHIMTEYNLFHDNHVKKHKIYLKENSLGYFFVGIIKLTQCSNYLDIIIKIKCLIKTMKFLHHMTF